MARIDKVFFECLIDLKAVATNIATAFYFVVAPISLSNWELLIKSLELRFVNSKIQIPIFSNINCTQILGVRI